VRDIEESSNIGPPIGLDPASDRSALSRAHPDYRDYLGSHDGRNTMHPSILSSSDHMLFGRLEAARALRWADWAAIARRWAEYTVGGEPLRSVGVDPLRNPEQLGAHGSACVRARCLLMSQLLCLASSLAPCLVRRDRERPDAVVRVRASSPHWRVVVPYGLHVGDGTVV
jgi:hypothetical protein